MPTSEFLKTVKSTSLLMLAALLPNMAFADSKTSARINEAAVNALDEANFRDSNGVVELYGIQTNGPDTNYGNWACAKVVTIVLREARVVNKISLGVRHVEQALARWQKIENEDALKPGDVIFWVNRFTGREDKRCTGGGNCHVGIVTEKGYFHNSPISNAPTFGGVSLWAFEFKYGARPPE